MTGSDTPIRSVVPGVSWPSLPTGRGAQLLALLYQFEQTQRWPAERLLEHQLRQLGHVLRHAVATVPYYRDRLIAAGFDPKRKLTQGAFHALPLLTRRDVQTAGAAMHSTAVPRAHGRISEARTTGSTGEPVTVRRTQVNQLLWAANTLRDHHWHRRNFSGKLALIRATGQEAWPPHGLRLPNWGHPAAELYDTGPMVKLNASADLPTQAQWVLRQNPDYLMIYPSLFRSMLTWFSTQGKRPSRLREVRTIGETVDASLREACRDVLGISIVDCYSSEEMGYIALQCPASDAYHVMSESVLVEVIGDDGKPCAPGEMGQVVTTSLHNSAMPMVRYVVGDYAEAGAPCSCGLALPTLARVVGKIRSLITLPSGKRFRPTFVTEMKDFPMIRQYQLIQRSLEDIEARLAVDKPLSAQEEARLRAVLQNAAGHPFHFSLIYFSGELPRGPRDKFEDFISRVTA